MKKILNVVSVYYSIPSFFGDQLKYFTDKGYDIHIVCSPSNKLKGYAKEQNASYKEINIPREISLVEDVKSIYNLYSYLKKEKFDIVVGHTPKGALISMIASFLTKTPHRIYFRHGIFYETKGSFGKFLFKNVERFISSLSNQVVCVSPFVVERSLEDKLTKKDKLVTLNIGSCNGIETHKQFNPKLISNNKRVELLMKLGLQQDQFVIGYVGRLIREKGIIELVEAFSNLSKTHKNIKLLLVGPFEDKDKLPDYAFDMIKQDSNIVPVGNIDRNDIEYYYSIMDVLVLPTYRDGLGNVLLEASSMEVPVLASSHTGSRDAVVNNVTGEYLKLDSKNIGKKLEKLIYDKNLCSNYGKNGRKHMIKNFDQEIIWKEIEEKLYKDKG